MVPSVVSTLPGHAQVAAVDVQRMGDAEFVHRARQCPENVARRHPVDEMLGSSRSSLRWLNLKAVMPPGLTTLMPMHWVACRVQAT